MYEYLLLQLSAKLIFAEIVLQEPIFIITAVLIIVLLFAAVSLFIIVRRLKVERHLFKVLMENTTDSIYFKDKESRFIKVNQSTVEKLGFSSESEVVGKSDFDIFTDEHARKAFEDEKNIIKSGEPLEGIEEKETWTDGRITWVSSTKLPLYDENNEIIGTFGITRDITKIKEAEEKLLEAKNRIELLFNLVPSAVFIVDQNKIVTQWNKRAEEITGFSREEIVGRECTLFADSPCREKCGLFENNIEKPIIGAQCTIKRKDGQIREISKNVDIIKDKDGNLIGGIESFDDVTEQNRIKTALKNSEENYRKLYENSTIGIYKSHPDGKVIMANPALLKFLGYDSLEELTAIDIAKDGYADEHARIRFKESLEKNGEIFGFENAWKKSDGSIVYLRESARVAKDDNGKVLFYEGTVEDITDRIQAEKKLKKIADELKNINASKDKFFSIIAHDLKSPFTAILGYSEILMNEAEELEKNEVREFTTNLNSVARSTFSLLSNLLEWSRLQTHRMKFEPEEFPLIQIVNPIVELLSQNALSKNIKIKNEIAGGQNVFADGNMVSTVIRNLVTNAIKFTPHHGEIIISSQIKDGEILTSVQDNGIGINEADLPKLFRIDVQHTTEGTDEEKGTGLGLLLCKELIELNNGRIWVESEVGKGSKFYFTLPIQPKSEY